MKQFLEKITTEMYGISLFEAHEKSICIKCQKKIVIKDFPNDETRIGYEINGYCTECQG